MPEREEREKGIEVFEKIMTQNVSKLTSDSKSQMQEAQRIPNRINTKQTRTYT